ncbi:hypothetical protein CIPAW_08G127000 [Carya illinoinensis]|uniref:Uncharacterized protein n=1 Tax=Carya illinoinensis TaxID=32201 RepID=A0A8T1PVR1_CARIL|nr:hypothetical protein CIPAW_08G127000 [Carya illinoinensis]
MLQEYLVVGKDGPEYVEDAYVTYFPISFDGYKI